MAGAFEYRQAEEIRDVFAAHVHHGVSTNQEASIVATRTQPTGKCALCGGSFPKGRMLRHLAQCAYPDAKAIAAVTQLRVDVPGTPFWLDLDVNPTASLRELDDFLREIWLECCDHLSSFQIGREIYYGAPFEAGPVMADGETMRVRMSRALPPDRTVFAYEYDFGSTTRLRLQVTGHYQAPSRREPVRLLARNDAPVWKCTECGEEATTLCSQCSYEGDAFFCEAHGEAHECGEEALLPVVNSPRMGVCAYGA